MKVLNLYAGIGGNRKLWEGVEVTAVEINPKIAEIYQKHFPQDKVIVADAHQFLLEHFKEFDFIWSSPPCPSHSRLRLLCVNTGQNKPLYPNMELYEEILFLMQYCKSKWVVENVISWYEPLIKPFESGRHFFWSNFHISKLNLPSGVIKGNSKDLIEAKIKRKGFDMPHIQMEHKEKLLNNCTEPELGLHVFRCAFKDKQQTIQSWGIGERKGVSPLGSDSRRTA